jgi:hypothetical protein
MPYVTYVSAQRLRKFKVLDFLSNIGSETVVVDFDAREVRPKCNTLRNHGTKFRMKIGDLSKIWGTIIDHTNPLFWASR